MAKLEEEIAKIIKQIKSPNIAVIGRTGVGKSTLINAVFGVDVAKTGAGLPVSRAFIRYPRDLNENSLVVLYDSAGYEANKETEFIESTFKFIDDLKSKGIAEQIHLVWYVVNAASARFEFFDRDIICNINNQGIPVIIVLSQCDRAKPDEIHKIKQAIRDFDLTKVYELIEVSASPLVVSGKPICEPYGLQDLVEKTVELLPEVYSDAVIAMQMIDIKKKRKIAWNYIATAATACFAASFIPIPFTTPVAAITAQTALCTLIAKVYGYTEQAEFLGSVSGFTTSGFFSMLSTATLDLISPIFPGGAVLSGGIAATYTTVLGVSYASVFEKVAQEHVSKAGRKDIENFIKKSFKEEFAKYSVLKIVSISDLEKIKKLFLQ